MTYFVSSTAVVHNVYHFEKQFPSNEGSFGERDLKSFYYYYLLSDKGFSDLCTFKSQIVLPAWT